MTAPERTRKKALPATFFAPPERDSGEALREAVARVSNSEILSAALEALSGWVAVLNTKRQVLAVNHALLNTLGISDPDQLLGLRPGEVLHCVHAQDHPGGCGTSKACTTCGAAIAIMAALEHDQPEERECILTYRQSNKLHDRAFVVRCCPAHIENERLLLICMRDVSEEKRRTALEDTFLHDISNLLGAVHLATAALRPQDDPEAADVLTQLRETTAAILREVKVQKILARGNADSCALELEQIRPAGMLEQVRSVFARHPALRGQEVCLAPCADERPFETDSGLLMRILTNMILNALEAGSSGDQVRVLARASENEVEFQVWNRQVIGESNALRVFQRFFSTKPGGGRGLGTYSMKLLGEQVLGGAVSFTSTPEAGTTFSIRLPRVFGRKLAQADTSGQGG